MGMDDEMEQYHKDSKNDKELKIMTPDINIDIDESDFNQKLIIGDLKKNNKKSVIVVNHSNKSTKKISDNKDIDLNI